MEIKDFVSWLNFETPAPAHTDLLAAFGVGLLLCILPFTWRRLEIVDTYFHELGHALAALFTGNKVHKIRIEANAGGVTYWSGRSGRFGRAFIAFCGYPAPAITGWFLMLSVRSGHPHWAITAAAVIAIVFALVQRSLRGWLLTALVLGASFGLYLTPQNPHTDQIVSTVLAGMAGFLLLASPRSILALRRIRRSTPKAQRHSDSDALSKYLVLPAFIWEIVFLILCAFLVETSVIALLI